MSAELARFSTLSAGTSADARRRLTEAIEPGRRRLQGSSASAAVSVAATAAGFYAVAAVAQDVLVRRPSWALDLRWLVLLLGAAALRATTSYLAVRLATDGAITVQRSIRARLLERVLSGGGDSLSSAAQTTAVIDEVERIGAYAERYEPARIAAAIVPVVLLAVVFPLSWPVGVLLVLCLPLPPLNLSIVGMGTAAVAREHGDELRQLSGYFLDRLRGLATLRALGAEQAELERVRAASERLAARAMVVLRVAFVSAAVLEAIVMVAVAIVAMYVGLTLLGYVQVPGLPSHMSLRTGLFVLMVTPLYFQPVRTLAAAYRERADALAAAESLATLLSPGPSPAERAAQRLLLSPPAVEIARLRLDFADRAIPALDDVSLTVEPGELIGLTGASGAGKSTLLRIIAGHLEATAGAALIDGKPAAAIERTEITWLGQTPYMFSGAIADNIALGQPDADDFAVLQAALAAGLGPVLARLPDGLQTSVGEAGWGLSGGEAHRVALARAFLKCAHLVLLDEPTAHLDAVSEAAIVDVIGRLAGDATVIVASHSPAVVAACDRVLALDRGRVRELLGRARAPEAA
jgi:ATP-binding cassette subfamily C protein CydD